VVLPTAADTITISKMLCPRCATALTNVDGSAVLCPSCHGLFLPPLAWRALLLHPERSTAFEERFPPRPPPPDARVRIVACPACGGETDRVRFASVSDAVIDVCPHRHGVWLDAGELGAVARFVGDRDAIGEDALRAQAQADDNFAEHAFRGAVQKELAIRRAPSTNVVLVDDARLPSTSQIAGTRIVVLVLVMLLGGGGIGIHRCSSGRSSSNVPPPAAAAASNL
jgi:Zn-finger nucleic acid-binding protein